MQLTESEIFDLRSRCNAVKLWRFPENLPLDLHLNIWNYLDLEDLMAMRLVCGRWSRTFSNVIFCEQVVKRHFPRRYKRYEQECQMLQSDDGENNIDAKHISTRTALNSWLETCMKCRYRRASGRFHSMATYLYVSGGKPQLGDLPTQPQYCSGRVAFQRDARNIVVKCLQSDSEEIFTLSNRFPFTYWLLSDRYLLAATSLP